MRRARLGLGFFFTLFVCFALGACSRGYDPGPTTKVSVDITLTGFDNDLPLTVHVFPGKATQGAYGRPREPTVTVDWRTLKHLSRAPDS
ncbi:MAG: hypothetical protein VCD00_08455 [Candidatus Hydrogenedentota bacterium]